MVKNAVNFGDHVRILDTEATRTVGLAGLTGVVFGETTPSITNIEVIGEIIDDYAVSVYFEQSAKQIWFASDQLELLDHNPGSTATIDGVNKKWVRTSSGEWKEQPGSKKYPDLFKRFVKLFFKDSFSR
jgi:hypothetical protein